ncbi:2-keto-3-deoxygluconate permease [Sporosalibacterium faouarense]|uniref:2-keto-3-deoxygluconate permease n=1 Tax=Sporosalibacterium faouarense TaxID=516123 RepID=UPI00141C3BDD|nr:2-keto-3-deoxygluconate permease [Sporosalibacterium faouarense]MTI47180.1 2-keto-3-deoxygluconate permease [Bacillota bacterium]
MKILDNVKKIPGGLMVVPLLIGAVINTFFPQIMELGGLHSAFFSKAAATPAIAFFLVCVGSQINFKNAPEAIKRGGVLLITKFLAGALFGYVVGRICGPTGFLGVSTLAIISSVTNSNGGLFMALMGEFGDSTDIASQAVMNINDGPFLTMVALGATGMANIPFMILLAAISPILFGCILGNLDNKIREFLAPGLSILIPFFAFGLGAGIKLTNVVSAGFSGILLGIIVIVVSGIPMFFADRYINRRPGYAAAAASSAAGNSVATPAAVALAVPAFEPLVEIATTQIAAAVIVTTILTPLITTFVAKKVGSARTEKEVLES